MPRIRTVKPTHWTDKNLSKISFEAHLLWIATWNFSDDLGIFEDDPLLLRSNIFPRRTDVKLEHITKWLQELEKYDFIIRFEYLGEPFYVTRTFRTNQRIDKPQPSKIPVNVIDIAIQEHSKNVQGTIQERSALYSTVVDSNVKEGNSIVVGGNEASFHTETSIACFEFLKKETPKVQQMKEPLTHQQINKLINDFGKDQVKETLYAMQNYEKLLKTSSSANLTIRNWIKKYLKENKAKQDQAINKPNSPLHQGLMGN